MKVGGHLIFSRDRSQVSADHRRLHALYEIAITVADVLAAVLFVIGSVCFFSAEWQTLGTWLFLIGSVMFVISPTIKVVREFKLAALGDVDTLATREEER